jgi:hypothetical protein
VGSRWCNDECVLLECSRLWVLDGVMMSVFSSSVVDCGFSHASLHHREPTIYHTRGEQTHLYTIENPQSTTLEENTLIIKPSRTHNLLHSRRTHSSLHHLEPTIYHIRGEHTHHYTIENLQSTTLDKITLIITPSECSGLWFSMV